MFTVFFPFFSFRGDFADQRDLWNSLWRHLLHHRQPHRRAEGSCFHSVSAVWFSPRCAVALSKQQGRLGRIRVCVYEEQRLTIIGPPKRLENGIQLPVGCGTKTTPECVCGSTPSGGKGTLMQRRLLSGLYLEIETQTSRHVPVVFWFRLLEF